MRARGRGTGILPCWDAVLEGVSSQEQRAAGSLCRAVGMGGFIAAPQPFQIRLHGSVSLAWLQGGSWFDC